LVYATEIDLAIHLATAGWGTFISPVAVFTHAGGIRRTDTRYRSSFAASTLVARRLKVADFGKVGIASRQAHPQVARPRKHTVDHQRRRHCEATLPAGLVGRLTCGVRGSVLVERCDATPSGAYAVLDECGTGTMCTKGRQFGLAKEMI
jgi:hypothetical protein